ncbi:MAG TPA: UbiH/UbiF family hydroxylase [Paracoccaceae bacterium]|nr:UbiH/UbiF family hydroxylase [Paracoccaceae bacterium]
MVERTDILISGGGPAGLAAAAAFGSAGFTVVLVDPAPPVTEAGAEGADLRTTAILQPGADLLARAGLWDRLAPHAAPLQVMRIVDAGGETAEPRLVRDFDAADISDRPFGWNFPNWLLRREMVAHLATLQNVDFRPGIGTAGVLAREAEARVTLSDGARIAARLLVGADGRDSPVRRALGIGATTLRYGQKALAFAVTHPIPHRGVSTEIHRWGGPFTLVPLPDQAGHPASAVVWMDRGPEIDRLAGLGDDIFGHEASERSGHILGPLSPVTRRQVWPIIARLAEAMTGPRTALMAEAAHVIPPIGAQGLNMSLADLAALLDLAEADRPGLGGPAMLAAYARARAADVRMRVMGVDALNRASMIGARPLRDLRAAALDAFYSVAPLRRALMRRGLGTG